MEYVSLGISVLALLVSFYFSYKPFLDSRKGLKSKLLLYREVFHLMVEEWEESKPWIAELVKNEEKGPYKGSIYFRSSVFEHYALNDSDLTILAGLGSYNEDFGYASREKAPYLKLQYFIKDFLNENQNTLQNEHIRYDFATVDLAEHYANRNLNSDYEFSKFMVGFLDSAIEQL